MSTQPSQRRFATEAALQSAESRLAGNFDPKGAAAEAEAAAKAHASTLAYGTDLQATDATVAALAADPEAEVGSYLANNYESMQSAAASYVTSHQIRRFVVTRDRETPLADGDVLIPAPTPRFLTDFHRTPVGQQPAGWAQRWVDGTWVVEADSEALSGKVLRTGHTGGEDRYGLTWLDDESMYYADAELIARWRTESAVGAPRLSFRGSGSGNDKNAVSAYLDVINSQLRVAQFIDGSFSSWSASFPAETGTWYITRARMFGSTLSVKTWADGQAEPGEWGLSREMSFDGTPLAGPGWIGLHARTAGTDIDWVGLAFDGGRAPAPEVM